MAPRSRCELAPDVCETLLKAHVSLDNHSYLEEDVELVVKGNVGFLTAVASHTNRLASSKLAAAVSKVLGANPHVAQKFAVSMTQALSYCQQKGRQSTTGKRLTEHVRLVFAAFRRPPPGSLGSGKTPPASSKQQQPEHQQQQQDQGEQTQQQAREQQLQADDLVQCQGRSSSSSSTHNIAAIALPVSDSKHSLKRDIYALYGLSPPRSSSDNEMTQGEVWVLSSQESAASAVAPAGQQSALAPQAVTDEKINNPYRGCV